MEFIAGSIDIDDRPGVMEIWDGLQAVIGQTDGVCGYQNPSCGVPEKTDIPSFVIVCKDFGLVLIEVVEERVTSFGEEGEYWQLDVSGSAYSRDIVLDNFQSEIVNRINQNSKLYDRRKKKAVVEIAKLLIFRANTEDDIIAMGSGEALVNDWICAPDILDKLSGYLNALRLPEFLSDEIMDNVLSDLETTSVFERRREYLKPTVLVTKNDFIRASLARTFKLDETQRKVARQLPNGPQRIRGLAGTGKTVILSMKAALTHKDYPDFKILLTFNTQSMYNTINHFVSKYYTAETRKPLNPAKLEIYHAWGGKTTRTGVYYELCKKYGVTPKTLNDVMGSADPMDSIYRDFLDVIGDKIRPEYDMILIDEAQDFSPAFFETMFYLAKNPKRIIWAYDEFQTLKELRIREPEDLFGVNLANEPNMPNNILYGKYNQLIDKDFVLPNSYRNPRQPLMAAHGLALGLQRQAGIIDVFSKREEWEAIGYQVDSPDKDAFEMGDKLDIERPESNSKNNLELLIHQNGGNDDQLIKFKSFQRTVDEIDDVAEAIGGIIRNEGVDPHEIVVVTLDTRNAPGELKRLRQKLDQLGIQAVIPGIVEGSSVFKQEGFVTLTTPFRAKGNEAHIVFVLNCQAAANDSTLRGRNALFVAITRAQGWCYLTGSGPGMEKLIMEIRDLRENYPHFVFTQPDPKDIARNRTLLMRADKEVQKQDMLLNELIDANPELLIEKIKSRPDLLKEINSTGKK